MTLDTYFSGLRLVGDRNLPDGKEWRQVRFPRSKKRRIRKKWRKRWANWRRVQVAQPPIYRVGDMVLCHPSVLQQVKEALSP